MLLKIKTVDGVGEVSYQTAMDMVQHGHAELVDFVVEDGVLRGAALDQALEEAGLPKGGTADEKRARLEDHRWNGALDAPSES